MEKHTAIAAVITGDIIGSGRHNNSARQALLDELTNLFDTINRQIIRAAQPLAEVFRGDSFQMVIPQPDQALRVGLIIRAKLRSLTVGEPDQAPWDARLSIGIGEIAFRSDKIVTSDGTAFQLSGRGLDAMKKKQTLQIRTPWSEVNEELAVACALSDAIIQRWTVSQAAVIYPYLLENRTQQELATQFNITQGAVSQRLNEGGHLDALQLFIQRYENLIIHRI